MSDDGKTVTNAMKDTDIDHVETMESLFFAYRGFVAGPDEILAEIEFGRAHHRALFFVNRRPGLTVAELLEILKITKQSLARVLKQLINGGFISQCAGTHDRRKRLLFPTPKGRKMILKLSQPQADLIEQALENFTEEERQLVATFLGNMSSANSTS